MKPRYGRARGRAHARRLPGQMNGLERRYADHLNALLALGRVDRWDYEPETLRLAPKTTYTPDFRVVLPDGLVEFHETKGFMRDDAHVKLKVAAALHPYTFRLVTWTKAEGFTITEVAPGTGDTP